MAKSMTCSIVGRFAEGGCHQVARSRPRPALLEFLAGRPHGGDLLGGQGLEGLGYQVGVGGDHLLPAGRLHHVRHVTVVDELYSLRGDGD